MEHPQHIVRPMKKKVTILAHPVDADEQKLHARIQKVLSEGVQLTDNFLFWLMRLERTQIPLEAGHHRPNSETPFKWRFAGVTMMAKYCKLAW